MKIVLIISLVFNAFLSVYAIGSTVLLKAAVKEIKGKNEQIKVLLKKQ